MGFAKAGSIHSGNCPGGASLMDQFLLPTYGFGEVLTAYRPDPSSDLSRSIDSPVSSSQAQFVGSYLPSIYRTADGQTVLGGHTQDSTGAVVQAPPVVLNVFKRQELTPVTGGAVPAAIPSKAGNCAVCEKVKAQFAGTNWKKVAVVGLVVVVGYHLFSSK
jgi:hypothetical protein